MTDTPIRERLARAAYPEWFGESGKVLANYPGQDKQYRARAFAKVDNILSELQEPSEGMAMALVAGLKIRVTYDGDNYALEANPNDGIRSLLRHIRDGGR